MRVEIWQRRKSSTKSNWMFFSAYLKDVKAEKRRFLVFLPNIVLMAKS